MGQVFHSMNTRKNNLLKTIAGGEIKELFLAYFNNRMTVLLMMIEHPEISRDVLSVQRQKYFLDDLYHHFLPSQCPTRYRRAFEWLFRFLDTFPDIPPRRIYTAIRMIGLVYEVFGLELEERIEAVRLEREGIRKRRRQWQKKSE